MKVIRHENTVACDIDDTILLWDSPNVDGPGKVKLDFAGGVVYLTPHNYHIQLLKTYHERGYYITFWSANGYQHAERAVRALGLEYLADGENGHVQCKLAKYLDDNPNPAAVLGTRVFCEDLTKPIVNETINISGPITTYQYRGVLTMPSGAIGGGVDKNGSFCTYSDGTKIYYNNIPVVVDPAVINVDDFRGVLNGR